MKIAIASGKGGTGKTLVAINLALSVKADQILDCDVEEPNDHIFLRPKQEVTEPVEMLVPEIIDEKCTYCGKCVDLCQFNALFVASKTAMVFPELCHSCGGCSLVCPENAIKEIPRTIGEIITSKLDGLELVYGKLDVGEAISVPVITAVKEKALDDGLVVIDSPPGSACPVVESVTGTDYCVMVTEPTPFGLHDLEVAVEVVKKLGIPLGVVVNFSGIGDSGVYDYCSQMKLPILLEIPYDRRIAELYSQGIPFIFEMVEWKKRFYDMYEKILELSH
jgi:MinD superfamily P-loop ATPase